MNTITNILHYALDNSTRLAFINFVNAMSDLDDDSFEDRTIGFFGNPADALEVVRGTSKSIGLNTIYIDDKSPFTYATFDGDDAISFYFLSIEQWHCIKGYFREDGSYSSTHGIVEYFTIK